MPPRIIKSDFDHWFDNGIQPETRVIYLGNISHNDEADCDEDPGIHWNTARRVIQSLHLLDTKSLRSKKDFPITIIMNSVGGDWSHGMAIYDAIRACKSHVTIINMSHARSMTSVILQAGDYRITAPSGYYMIHDGVTGGSDIPRTMINNMEYEKNVALPMMYNVYLDRLHEVEDGEPKVAVEYAAEVLNPKLPSWGKPIQPRYGVKGIKLETIEALCSRDTYFTASEMVKLNLADRILERGDLSGAFANNEMHGLPTGLASLYDEDD